MMLGIVPLVKKGKQSVLKTILVSFCCTCLLRFRGIVPHQAPISVEIVVYRFGYELSRVVWQVWLCCVLMCIWLISVVGLNNESGTKTIMQFS